MTAAESVWGLFRSGIPGVGTRRGSNDGRWNEGEGWRNWRDLAGKWYGVKLRKEAREISNMLSEKWRRYTNGLVVFDVKHDLKTSNIIEETRKY